MKLDIDRIKSDLGPVTRVSDETAFGVVRNFRAAVSRHAADQAATKLLHGCIDRIYVLPDWNEAEQTMQHRIRVVFNIPETIKNLRNAALASAPSLAETASLAGKQFLAALKLANSGCGFEDRQKLWEGKRI